MVAASDAAVFGTSGGVVGLSGVGMAIMASPNGCLGLGEQERRVDGARGSDERYMLGRPFGRLKLYTHCAP